MAFKKEKDFEDALIGLLTDKYKWDKEVLNYPTEEDLIQNWANILFQNNCDKDKLNDVPLTRGEMQQILTQVNTLRTPVALNEFINGRGVTIQREAEDDQLHYGKNVTLKLFDRLEIFEGKSRYQIARQPRFTPKGDFYPPRRGDFTLLINGMPLIHVELKRTGIDVSQACWQIEKYAHEGVFTGIFSLVQVFVAMNPEETLYFANPGPDGKFNKDFYFHWENSDKEIVGEYYQIAEQLLSIPMAHQLIGFYTVADRKDGILKVMRSYQYMAANAILNAVKNRSIPWEPKQFRGGHVWHTTGSGKTMTSFKAAQLIVASKCADKVVFLTDRIELGMQSLDEYRNFARADEAVQQTENSAVLADKLKSDNVADTLIVTSIQKMSHIHEDSSFSKSVLQKINRKRIVFIEDEAHRSTFGDMLQSIRSTFPSAMLFGFTGTPIQEENRKKLSTTLDVFGDELDRYTLADGIRDKNVLGFDPYQVHTYRDKDLRLAVALEKAKAQSIEEAYADEKKKKVFMKFMNDVPMAGRKTDKGHEKGIEDYIPTVQYEVPKHQETVVRDILDNWTMLSHNGKFHAIFATSSIPEAVQYYRLFKKMGPQLKVTALFDPNTDGIEAAVAKEKAIREIVEDYNKRYGKSYKFSDAATGFKKDVATRLAHKRPYGDIDKKTDEVLDLLIVVNQMLTGFDSKWLNTLYLDKVLEYEGLIQAFSRTNRIFGPEKPFGIIRYYRYPNIMARNIEEAFDLYSGNRPYGLFVEKLSRNIKGMNASFQRIKEIFQNAGIEDFVRLPKDQDERGAFAKAFKELNEYLEAAKVQGFTWNQLVYDIDENGEAARKFLEESDDGYKQVSCIIDEQTYLTLAIRYKELFSGQRIDGKEEVPFEIAPYLTEINTDHIDAEYMNSRFKKYVRVLQDEKETDAVLTELHRSFTCLTEEEQDYAMRILTDVRTGRLIVEEGKTFRDYITEYMVNFHKNGIRRFARNMGIDGDLLEKLMESHPTEKDLNNFGRFDQLKETLNISRAKPYLERIYGKLEDEWDVRVSADGCIRNFILSDGKGISDAGEDTDYEVDTYRIENHKAAETSDPYGK